MSTNDTYRFVNIVEQVFTMIGEGKHGLWRVQDNGMIREYRKAGKQGIPKDANIFDEQYLNTIQNSYSHYLSDESWGGYKLPKDKIDESGHLQYIDLPVSHPKYQGEYQQHTAIDLPHWYCTMSDYRYPYEKKAMDFAFAQPGANKVGPNLWGIVGAKKARRSDFLYSKAMTNKGGRWTKEELYHFLHKPSKYLPGTKMSFVGISKAEDISNVIAYLSKYAN